jgi:hypothetical protein
VGVGPAVIDQGLEGREAGGVGLALNGATPAAATAATTARGRILAAPAASRGPARRGRTIILFGCISFLPFDPAGR